MDNDLTKEFEQEVERLKEKELFSSDFRKRKFILYLIRTSIAIILVTFLWEHKWVRWSLFLYVPLNLLSLFSIFGWNYFLNKKIEKTRRRLEELEKHE